MKKLLTLLCVLAVCGEFGYLLLKDHPHWPEIVWTPALWTATEAEVVSGTAAPDSSGALALEEPAGGSPEMDAGPAMDSSQIPASVPASTSPIDVSSPSVGDENGGQLKFVKEDEDTVRSAPDTSELVAVPESPPAEVAESVAESMTWADQLFEPTVSSVSAASAKQVREPGAIEQSFASLVRVIQTGAGSGVTGGRRGQAIGQTGLGVILDVDSEGFQVLTAAHVVAQSADLDVELIPAMNQSPEGASGNQEVQSQRFRSVEVMGQDAGRDLALLRVHWPLADPERMIPVGLHSDVKHIWVKSQVWLAKLNDVDGVVRIGATVIDQKRARREIDGPPVEYLVLDQVSVPGMSGGGLFAESGELIGIISGNGGGRLHCIASSEIKTFLSETKSD